MIQGIFHFQLPHAVAEMSIYITGFRRQRNFHIRCLIKAFIYISTAEFLSVIYAAATHDYNVLIVPFQRCLGIIQTGLFILLIDYVLFAAFVRHHTRILLFRSLSLTTLILRCTQNTNFYRLHSTCLHKQERACTVSPHHYDRKVASPTRFLSI